MIATEPVPLPHPVPTWRSGWRRIFARLCTLSLVSHLLIALWIYFLVPRNMEDPDIWWHLRNAQLEWQMHGWLQRDLYSFTAAGAPWINHEWLAEVPFYLGWHLAGSTGLYLVTLFTLEFILLGVYRLGLPASDRSVVRAGLWPIVCAMIASVLATVSFGPRMLLFGWACLVVELSLFRRFVAVPTTRSIYLLPPLFLLWINLHGSWLIGLVLFVVFFAAGSVRLRAGALRNQPWTPAQARTLFGVLLLTLGALLVNPYGWHLVAYPFDLAFHQRLNVASAAEWKPLDFQSARGVIFLCTLGILFLAQVLRRISWTLGELAFAAIAIYASVRHSRFLFLGAILLLPLVAEKIAQAFPGRLRSAAAGNAEHPRLNALLIGSMAIMAIVASLRGTRTYGHPLEQFPVTALPFLEHFHPQGRIFNEYLWGGYLAYNVPTLPVFIDSRMDIFERNGTLRDYLDTIYLKHSLLLLDKYKVRYVLYEKETPLVYLLSQTGAWKPDYDDGSVILLERSRLPASRLPASRLPASGLPGKPPQLSWAAQ